MTEASSKYESRPDISEIVAKADLVGWCSRAGVQLRKKGRDYKGLCPFHQEKTPSFWVYDKPGQKQNFHCFGCGADGDAINFIERIYNVSTREAIEMLTGKSAQNSPPPRVVRASIGARGGAEDAEYNNKIDKALSIWQRKVADDGTVHRYLGARGIDLDKIGGLPASLNLLHQHYWWYSSEESKVISLGEFPAMLAPIQNAEGGFIGVHMTYLDPYNGKKLEIFAPDNSDRALPAKKIRGHQSGGCIRLGKVTPRLYLAEGIETALSVKATISGTHMDGSVWTFVSLGNLKNVKLPQSVSEVWILEDNDMKTPAKGQADPRLIYESTARRFVSEGRRTFRAKAAAGGDYNDMLGGA